MQRQLLVLSLCAVATALVACADPDNEPSPLAIDEAMCGIIDCTEGADDDIDPSTLSIDVAPGGKADAADRVAAKLVDVTADDELSVADVEALFDAAGARISVDEIAVVRDAIADTATYTVLPEAAQRARALALVANVVNADEIAQLQSGVSFGGTEVPPAVRDVLANARLNGAIAYDVEEVDEDGEKIWTHYPSISPAVGNMAFDYTEITPQKLADDLTDADVEYNAIVGVETATTAWGQEYQRARYEARKGGSGNIIAHYDEVHHQDLFARGSQSQKWANNFAILSDGSLHCLPAARRDVNQRVILTNPGLARGKMILFNGHLDVIAGEVVAVELSGRLSKLAGAGKAVFIDPIPLLEAWGFNLSPTVSLRYGNTENGRPVQADFVVKQAPAPTTP